LRANPSRVLVYWLIFAAFAVGSISYASTISRRETAPVSGAAAAAIARRSVVLTAVGVALIVLIGLRFRVGGDWANYLQLFHRLAPQDLSDALQGFRQEPGYLFLNWLAVRLGAGIWLVNLVCAIFFTIGLMALSRQQPNPWLALLVATPFLIVVVAMGYTRQAAAMGCFLVGLSRIIEKKPPLQFILWTLAGALFHRTVLVFVPIMLIATATNKFVSYVLVLAAVIVGYFTVLPAAIDVYAPGYVRSQLSASGAAIRVIMDVVPATIVLLSGRKFYWSPEEKAVWRTFAILCLVAGATLPFIKSSVVIDRLAIYLIPMQIFVYARIGYCFGLVRRGWLMWTTAIIVYSAAVLFVWLNYAVNAFAWIPYQNYLTSPERM
jgi:EpsG-like putative glucosyltransferase